jgi:hypothetical protein
MSADADGRTNIEELRDAQLVAELSAAGNALPGTLSDVAFSGQAASVVVTSAEGVTTFGGADADPEGLTRDWIDVQFKRLAAAHRAVNTPLKKLREEA